MSNVIPLTAQPPSVLSRNVALSRIVALSEEMLDDAESGRWERMADKESERQRLVWQLFAAHPEVTRSEESLATLTHVHAISEKLVLLAEMERGRVGQSTTHAHRTNHAHKAYGEQVR